MNLPPPLLAAQASSVINATGSVNPLALQPGASTELTFSLPLPAGFTTSGTGTWLVTLPPGFTLKPSVNFFGLSPYSYNAIVNPPQTEGPFSGPIGSFPAGTTWVWSTLNNQPTYANITLDFILRGLLNPAATGPTGNFLVQIGGTGATPCEFTVPGFTLSNA